VSSLEYRRAVPLALRFEGHRCPPDSAIKPWYQHGSLALAPGDVVRVPSGGLVLGRSTDADVRVASNGIARKHVRVVPSADGARLLAEDLGSTNGTQRNGATAVRHELAPGDVLTLAGFFDFVVIEVPEPP